MASGDIVTNYTDKEYLSKSELVVALRTSLIDPFWIQIEKYRRSNAIYLDLTSFSQIPFSLTLTPTISKKINDVANQKLTFLGNEYASLEHQTILKAQSERELLFSSLKAINDIEKLGLSDNAIKAVISGVNENENPNEKVLSNYLEALDYLISHREEALDENYLAGLWGKLIGESELTEFYRSTDSVNQFSVIQVNRDYFESPSEDIELHMEKLFSFMAGNSANGFQKSLATLYFVYYVKPFAHHNEAIASLFAKAILLKEHYGVACLYLPLEEILKPNFPKASQTFLNVQRDNDLTYFVLNSLDFISRSIDASVEIISKGKAKMMEEEKDVVYPSDLGNPINEEKAEEVHQEQLTLDTSFAQKDEEVAEPIVGKPVIETPKIETPIVETAKVETPVETVIEPPKPVETSQPIETPTNVEPPKPLVTEVPKPIVEPAKPTQVVPKVISPTTAKENRVAYNKKEHLYSDKEMREYAKYLLETHPNLKKHQAYFYSCHATIGRFYTIQDYKRYAKCVYETARTSMDALVSEGFYQKLQIKNKFVYTPVEGEKK